MFICALWSLPGKWLTSWLSFVVSNCEFVTFPLVSWVRYGTWLYLFLIFAPLLILKMNNSQRFCLEQEMHTNRGETTRVSGFSIIVGFCNCYMICYVLLFVHSSYAIIFMGKREQVALLSFVLLLSGDCCVALPRGAMGLSAVCDCGISSSYLLTISLVIPPVFVWVYFCNMRKVYFGVVILHLLKALFFIFFMQFKL